MKYLSRNIVKFNPENVEHRKTVATFMRRNAWGDCPIMFSNEPTKGCTADHVKDDLLRYFLDQEFDSGLYAAANREDPWLLVSESIATKKKNNETFNTEFVPLLTNIVEDEGTGCGIKNTKDVSVNKDGNVKVQEAGG